MMFGEIPVTEAVGAILAHGLCGESFTFKKGRVLTTDDVALLSRAGRRTVVAAWLETGEVLEDEAAQRVAHAISGAGIVVSAAATGRCNLHAAGRGLAVIDAGGLDRLNLVDEAITVATVPSFAVVEPRHMVATIKIIPFAAPTASIQTCEAIATEAGPLIRVAPLEAHRGGLIQTVLPGVKASVLESTVATTAARLAALGSTLAMDMVVAHNVAAVARAIADLKERGCNPILVLGASAIVDRRDVIPAAVCACGGEVIHFGMPVDPGNLLMLGQVGRVPVIGLPGCARSPKLNGFDWVLQRVLADIPIARTDIMRMGVGGLLTEIPTRPLPRKAAVQGRSRAFRIAAVVLAAGLSTRLAPANKLLVEIGGRPLICRAVEAALASEADPVLVIVGHEAGEIRQALAEMPVTFVDNPDYSQGLSTSIAAGIAALPDAVDGAVFILADMPKIDATHIDRLIAAFNPREGRAICVPTYGNTRGNPVLWAKRFFSELARLTGDVGGRALLGKYIDQVCEVEMNDNGILIDIDEPKALAELTAERQE
jgi:molybdenum cofactor cytidylyltransferase